jgi:hypothetical protein
LGASQAQRRDWNRKFNFLEAICCQHRDAPAFQLMIA